MPIKDIIPKIGKGRETLPARREERDPFLSLQRDMNRLFDDFFGSFGGATPAGRGLDLWGERELAPAGFMPRVDVTESDREVRISAELPGLDEKDVTVELDDASVTLRGERKEERESKDGNWFRKEQSYGAFHRVIPLPARVDGDKAAAKFKRGVLTVTLPKREEDRKKRRTVTVEAD